ncbi:MAG: hypothetical protein HN348_01090 [Proteobacteria bacterium]|nr:hypothetical protein [Pseudomonadota bacterium]
MRRADHEGLRPLPVQQQAAKKAPAPAASKPQPKDLMSQLVPGVVRQEREAPPAAENKPPKAQTAEDQHLVAEKSKLVQAQTDLVAQKANLEKLRSTLEGQQREFERQQAILIEEKATLKEQRNQLEEAKDDLQGLRQSLASGSSKTGTPLKELLQKRGLRGFDEFERAFGALAEARALRDILDLLEANDAKAVEERLHSRLLLVGGLIPEGLPTSVVAVTVAPDRAELPDGHQIAGAILRMGEQLMLCGLRRLLVIGGSPLYHRLLSHYLDSRIEVRFPQPEPRTRALAEIDVTRIDAVVLWGVEVLEDGREVYGTSRAMAIEVPQAADVIECAKLVCAALA